MGKRATKTLKNATVNEFEYSPRDKIKNKYKKTLNIALLLVLMMTFATNFTFAQGKTSYEEIYTNSAKISITQEIVVITSPVRPPSNRTSIWIEATPLDENSVIEGFYFENATLAKEGNVYGFSIGPGYGLSLRIKIIDQTGSEVFEKFRVDAIDDQPDQSGVEIIDNFKFDKNTGEIVAYEGNDEEVVIPQSLAGIEVTKIGKKAFAISERSEAFIKETHTLKKVVIPDKVTLGDGVFENCVNLTSVVLPSDLDIIPKGTFINCKNLIEVPSGNYSVIEEFAFNHCKIKTIKLPDTVKAVKESAFRDNKAEEIILNDGLEYIGPTAFGWNDEKQLSFPSTITYLGDGAFLYNINLEEVTIPEKITEIKSNLFAYSKNLNKVNFHNNISSIGDRAFIGNNLNNVEVPESVTELGIEVFKDCVNLTSIKLPQDTDYIPKGLLRNTGLTTYTLPMNIKKIGDEAFADCEKLETFYFNDIISEIGERAFSFTAVKVFDVPKSVKSIGYLAFESNNSCDVFIDNYKKDAPSNFGSLDNVNIHYLISIEFIVEGNLLKEFHNLRYNDPMVQIPQIPTKPGYESPGYSPIVPSTIPDCFMEYNAVYKPFVYPVVFKDYDDSEIESDNLTVEDKVNKPINPSRKGYRFLGWDPEFKDNVPIGGITYTAKYEKIPEVAEDKYLVSFFDYDNTLIKEDRLLEGDKIIAPNNPKRAGYTFKKWTPELIETVPKGGISFTAEYTKNSSGGGGSNTDKPDDKPDNKTEENTENPPIDIILPKLNKIDHNAYLVGYPNNEFRPNNNITRAETAVMFSNLLLDSIKLDKSLQGSYLDINNQWFKDKVNYITNQGIMVGYKDKTFRPNNALTRAEFAAIACQFDNLTKKSNTKYKDLADNHWAYNYIDMAITKGWLAGYPDGTIRPDEYITRAEVVSVTNKLLERNADKNYILNNSLEIKKFSDVSEKHWAYHNVIEATNSHNYTKEKEEIWYSIK